MTLSEVAKYTYKLQKDAERESRRDSPGGSVDFEMDDDDAWDIDMVEIREEID